LTGLAGVVACFVLSGFAALIYQTAWLRQFSLVFGTSELAVATVLAAYMAGLAAGAGVAGRFVGRVHRPILVYAALEAGIAASALAVPWLLDGASALQAALLAGQAHPPDAASIGQPFFFLAVAFLVLAVPTGFMGATLPLLTRHAVRTDREISPRVALLYASNTAGAVVGTLLAAFVLLPRFGLRATVWAGVAMNALVFVLAAALARRAPARATEPATPAVDGTPSTSPTSLRRPGWILPIMLVSGANAFAYEVLWTRMLSHVLGGSLYAFATMLAAFLSGIALGGGIAGRFARERERAAAAFAAAQIAIALLSMAVYAWTAASVPESRNARELAAYGFAVLLPATVAIGATFPLAVRILARDERAAAPGSARVYAWNTVGAIGGAILAGFVLLPGLGFEGSIRLGVCINLGLALATLAFVAPPRPAFAAGVAVALAAVALLYRPARPDAVIAASGFSVDRLEAPEELFYAVGRSSTVLLLADDGAYHLRTNGLPEASIRARGSLPGLESGAWLTALPVAARPDTRSMMVIGFGGGTSLEGVPPSVSEVDAVELEPEVIRANRILAGRRERDPLADPRIRVVVNDGRNSLRLTRKRYDAIVSQPSHPWTAGASHLFTREFVRLAKQHLTARGVFVQWMGSTLVSEPLLRSLAATLLAEFAHVRLYRPTPGALIFLASDAALDVELDLARTARPFAPDEAHFARLGMGSVEDLLAALALDRAGVAQLAAGATQNTDDANHMATRSRSRGDGLGPTELSALFAPLDPLLDAESWVHTQLGGMLRYAHLARRLMRAGQAARVPPLARVVPSAATRLLLEALVHRRNGDDRRAEEALRAAVALDPEEAEARYLLARDRRAEAAALHGSAAAVLAGAEHARAREWTALAALEPALATARATDLWAPEAARLRARWRLQLDDGRAEHAREALALIDEALHASSDPELRRMRLDCALLLGDADLLTESARAVAKGVASRSSRAARGDSGLTPREVEAMRSDLAAVQVALQGPIGADHSGARVVLRQSRLLLERLEPRSVGP
jgi:spermidine synthase